MEPREFLDRLMKEKGLNPTSLAAATKNRTKQPQIYRFLKGLAKEPKRSTWEPVAYVLHVSVEAFFDPRIASQEWSRLHPPTGGIASPSTPSSAGLLMRPVAQDLSLPSRDDELQIVTWEFIVSAVSPLPKRFCAAVPDDSLAPRSPRGTEFVFSSEVASAPDDSVAVIVQTSGGRRYMRLYFALDGGAWEARARDPAVPVLHSERDGLQLLAVAIFRPGGQA